MWRDDERGGNLVFDAPVVVQCYTSEDAVEQHADQLRDHLVRMGRETNQGAVGYVIDGHYYEIRFPLT